MSLRPCASGCGSFLASLDGHDHCLTCLGREHAEAPFTNGSCVHCERMTMAALKSRRSFASRLPLLSSRSKSLSRQGFSAAAARHLGDIQVTMQNAPPASKAPRTSASPRSPVECPKQFASPHAGPSVSFGAPQEVEMSATASEGQSEDEADVSAGRRPSAFAAPSKADAELSAMLLRAAKEIGLEAMQELRAATDFALRATKIADIDKARFLDTPISQGGLFGDTVKDFAQQFSAVQKQTEALRHIFPRRDSAPPQTDSPMSSWPRESGATRAARASGTGQEHPQQSCEASLTWGTTTSTSPLPEGREPLCAISQKESISSPLGFPPRVPFLSDALPPRIRTRRSISPAREQGKKTFLQDVLPSGISPLPLVSELIQTQDSGPSQNISEAPGAYGSCSRGDGAGLASYETASALVTRSSPEMGMAPWHTPDWCFPVVSPPVQPVAGVPLGQVSRHLVVSTGWGAVCNGQAASGSWTGPRLQWHIDCLELLAVLLALRRFRPMLRHKHVLVRTDSTATVAYINHQGGLRSRRMSQLARHLTWLKSLRAVHIPGELNRAADQLSRQSTHPGEWRLHAQVVQLIWSHFCEAQIDLFASPESSHCQLFYSLSEAPLGRDALAHSWPPGPKYAFPPVSLLAQTLCKIREDEEQVLLVAPYWPTRTWFPDLISLAAAPPWKIPLRTDLLSQGMGTIWQPHQTSPAFHRPSLYKAGLCTEMGGPTEMSDCSSAFLPAGEVGAQAVPFDSQVYVAAITVYHDAVDGASLGKHQLIVRVNPPRPHLVPSWDLSVTLQGLREAPFEPLASVELKHLSLKTALLTALASIKRVGDLQAFSFDEADSHGHPETPARLCAQGSHHAFPVVVNLQALPLEEADPASALLCPVRALRIYVDRTRHFRRTEQLFVCFGGQQKGNAVSKQSETTEGERLGYVRNPRSLKEGTETLHPLPRPYVALTPGCDSAPQRKPE
ncbi:hypothetical protein M9458_050694 [Cirrhinus mrigala]|uniref:Reverse transcriptase RNase H-like domain-containing protein n=1 Tax=Cirrhinus mrigala TaxID=683832 RepID=A0ABD0MYF9_CIRMR